MVNRDSGLDELSRKRRELANYASNKKKRDLGWPRVWQPNQVMTVNGLPFTDAGAWAFISEKLNEGHEIEEKILNKPKGKKGYVMKVKIRDEDPLVYIKVQFGNGKIIGRSFHYDR